jgi:hypothetical protein
MTFVPPLPRRRPRVMISRHHQVTAYDTGTYDTGNTRKAGNLKIEE